MNYKNIPTLSWDILRDYVEHNNMDFINLTGNSVYIEDIDLHIPYSGNDVQFIESDLIKKSESFQKITILGAFKIVSASNERIEQNLVRLQKERSQKTEEVNDEESRPMSDDKMIDVIIKGHFYEAGGYAKVNRNLALGLSKSGVNVEIKPVSTRQNDLNEMEVRMLGGLRSPVGRDAIRIDSIIPSMSDISPRSFYRILYTTIEAETIPQQTVDICNQYDEIWVTSDFCKEVLLKYKIRPNILVFPSTINVSLYHENHTPHAFCPSLNKFVFVSVFGWSYRKGYDALLRSYLQSFNGDDDVSLLIVSRFQNATERSRVIQQEISKFIKKYGGDNPAHIARCSRVIPEFEMPRIYKACNAFAIASRGEGFGLPICEASLCGLPVITTRHSGPLMFLDDKNSHLVDIDSRTIIQRGKMHVHYWDGETFPSLESEDFSKRFGLAMRDVYDNYEKAKESNKSLQSDLKSNYSVTSVCQKIKLRLQEIWQLKKR